MSSCNNTPLSTCLTVNKLKLDENHMPFSCLVTLQCSAENVCQLHEICAISSILMKVILNPFLSKT